MRAGGQRRPATLPPNRLIDWISALCPSTLTAIDCGAGLCDVSALLAARFGAVHAVDCNARALTQGYVAPNLSKVVADAADLPFRGGCADLIISMQSLHVFNLPRHVTEARRILKPGGILAALCYGDLALRPPLRRLFADLRKSIDPFWETEKGLTDSGYRTLNFGGGFAELTLPPAALKRRLSVKDLATYFAHSSAGRAATTAGIPLPQPSKSVEGWAIWPLHGRVFRKL